MTEKDKISYSIGLNIGRNFKAQSLDIDSKTIMKGIDDGFLGNKSLMTDQEMSETMDNLRTRMIEAKKKEGEKFLEENKKRKGVVSLPSGLQYEVIKQGEGNKPKLDDTVVTNYQGSSISGEVFDSSYQRGTPATFPVKGVIAGWTEALQLMQTGAKWKLFIPPNLAYGERGAGGKIGPNATLIFDIELIEIKPN
ncbi:FKBP-type peptidyl-prolyl cis-trans isomerase [bacterium]|nr:FKBP-type peptidyl-prolyl cis-trans isomerase [bacterium]